MSTTAEHARPAPDAPPPASRGGRPLLVGANPAVQLFDEDGSCTAYASVWRVDWSVRGSGRVLILWQPTGVTVLGRDKSLALWLTHEVVRYFPEVDGLAWPMVRFRSAEVSLDSSLSTGMVARAEQVAVDASGVLDIRTASNGRFRLGRSAHRLDLVLAPCVRGAIRVAGDELPGRIRLTGTPARPMSSAFVTEAETWWRQADGTVTDA